MEGLKITTQLESVLSCAAERSAISAVCDLQRQIVNEEQLHSKIWQFLASNNLNIEQSRSKRYFEAACGKPNFSEVVSEFNVFAAHAFSIAWPYYL